MDTSPINSSLGIFPSSWSEKRAGRIPGNIPIWVGILSELTEFGIFFIAYFVAKYNYPEAFSQGPQSLSTMTGVANTVVLISSSYFMAKAMANIRMNNLKGCEKFLWLAFFSGCLYLCLKTWEFHWNDVQGFSTNSSPFFTGELQAQKRGLFC
jgi:cytochrome c oxidase subunit 3